ncbi:hypothetical protein BJY52DRAFT_1193290 [Lactarius psammicola]|nr:hypothetical protein BJY52DRAFT_1193290 [Lactarius psammicola]
MALRCNPALIPFLPDDLADNSSSLILVDALVRNQEIAGVQPLVMPSSPDAELSVSVFADWKAFDFWDRPLEWHRLPFHSLYPHYRLAEAIFPYLHSDAAAPSRDSNQRTGGLLAKRARSQDPYEPIFPVGFFTQFGGYLEGNDGILEDLKSQGCVQFSITNRPAVDNVTSESTWCTPIPPFDNMAAFNHTVDKMEVLALWLMYDMHWSALPLYHSYRLLDLVSRDYKNSTSVTEQVTSIMGRPNLLLYYTADEPDGSDPPWAATTAAALVNSLDPYRPSSLVLNCQDYLFDHYAAGMPILMQDTYPIGINPNYSVMYERGCCGCDNCVGDFEDIRNRMDDFTMRLEVLGWERPKGIWTEPQGIGSTRFLSRKPSYTEFLVQMIVTVNVGARGSIAWTQPTTAGITAAASQFASALPELTPFLLSSPLSSPPVNFVHVVTSNRLDFSVWVSSGGKALIMAANLNYFPVDIQLDDVLSATQFKGMALVNPRLVVDGGARIVGTQVTFQGNVLSGA